MENAISQGLVDFFSSPKAKRAIVALCCVILLFFVCNDIFMPWFVNHGGTVRVPSLIGIQFEQARFSLDSLGLEAHQGDMRTSKDYPIGTVIAQNPLSGTLVKKGRRIYVAISGGEQLVQVPNLRGKTIRDAKFALERNGLRIGVISYAVNDSFPVNTIMGQSVAAFVRAKRGTNVSVTVNQGMSSDRISVPDVVGKTLTDAGKILANYGFKIGTLNYQLSTTLLPNTIVDQYPRPGELSEQGRAVDLFVVHGGEKRKLPTGN